MNKIEPTWPAPPHIKAFTTTRLGWVGATSSEKNSLPHGDEALHNLLALPTKPIWLTQKHTATVVEALQENNRKIADASYTHQPQTVCAVLTADCLPLLFCTQQGTAVAAIHAGWRGLAAGIIEATFASMQVAANDLLVWLGPAIGPKQFEVGRDVYDVFVEAHSASQSAFIAQKEGKWLANLYELAKIRLALLGISKIYGGDFCTYTQEDLFFSYRRNHGETGRMASLIWIEP